VLRGERVPLAFARRQAGELRPLRVEQLPLVLEPIVLRLRLGEQGLQPSPRAVGVRAAVRKGLRLPERVEQRALRWGAQQ